MGGLVYNFLVSHFSEISYTKHYYNQLILHSYSKSKGVAFLRHTVQFAQLVLTSSTVTIILSNW